jgi:hypothetical protein
MSKRVWYTWYGEYGLELKLHRDIILGCSHSGPCDADVEAALRTDGHTKRAVEELDPDAVVRYLLDTGGWDEEELTDDQENRERILWVVGGELREESQLTT